MKSSIYTPLQMVAWLVLDDGQRAMRSVVVLFFGFFWFFFYYRKQLEPR